MYWTSFIIQDNENSKPWLCGTSDPCLTIEKALKVIEEQRKNHRVLSAWIDKFDEKHVKTTAFHECYINAVGNVQFLNFNR